MINTHTRFSVLMVALVAMNASAQTTNTFPPSGNAGVGTTSPGTPLQVVGTGGNVVSLGEANNSSGKQLLLGVTTSGDGYGSIQALHQGVAWTPLILNPSGGSVGIGTTSTAAPLHLAAGNDPTAGQINCGAESSSCPASSGSGYGLALDADYGNGEYRWRFEPIDRGDNISLYFQETGGTANAYHNVVRFGDDQYDSNSFAVFGSTSLNGTVNISGGGSHIHFPDNTDQSTAWTGTLTGGDYAESVDITGDRTKYEPGDVLVIDPDHTGHFLKASERYSLSVAGVYSTRPGVVGRRQKIDKALATTEVPMAMVGIVPVKVSTENGPVRRGDVLVTSSTAGYAMKGTDRSLLAGAVIGKALAPLDSGAGVIEALISLQ